MALQKKNGLNLVWNPQKCNQIHTSVKGRYSSIRQHKRYSTIGGDYLISVASKREKMINPDSEKPLINQGVFFFPTSSRNDYVN